MFIKSGVIECSTLRKANYNRILINQMVAMAILDILFVSSAHYNTEGALCKVCFHVADSIQVN